MGARRRRRPQRDRAVPAQADRHLAPARQRAGRPGRAGLRRRRRPAARPLPDRRQPPGQPRQPDRRRSAGRAAADGRDLRHAPGAARPAHARRRREGEHNRARVGPAPTVPVASGQGNRSNGDQRKQNDDDNARKESSKKHPPRFVQSALVVVSLGAGRRNEACEVVEGAATPCAVRERPVCEPTTNVGSDVTMCRDVAREQDPNRYPAKGCARPYRRSRKPPSRSPASQGARPRATRRPPWASRRPSGPRTPAPGRPTTTTSRTPGRRRRRRSTRQTVSNLKVKWSFPFKGASAFGIFASTPIVLERHRLPPGPELERVRARSRHRSGQVAAHVQQAEHRARTASPSATGLIYGATETNVFALDAQTGKHGLDPRS